MQHQRHAAQSGGLRALQDEGALTELLDAVIEARRAVSEAEPPPIFLKVAPDLEPADIDAIARNALDKKLGALIVSNTTISRPELRSHHAGEVGGHRAQHRRRGGRPARHLARRHRGGAVGPRAQGLGRVRRSHPSLRASCGAGDRLALRAGRTARPRSAVHPRRHR